MDGSFAKFHVGRRRKGSPNKREGLSLSVKFEPKITEDPFNVLFCLAGRNVRTRAWIYGLKHFIGNLHPGREVEG